MIHSLLLSALTVCSTTKTIEYAAPCTEHVYTGFVPHYHQHYIHIAENVIPCKLIVNKSKEPFEGGI